MRAKLNAVNTATSKIMILVAVAASVFCSCGGDKYWDDIMASQKREAKMFEKGFEGSTYENPVKLPAKLMQGFEGRGKMAGDEFRCTLYNGTQYWVSYANIYLEDSSGGRVKKRLLRAERYLSEKTATPDGKYVIKQSASSWPPLTAAELVIPTGGFSADISSTNTFTWGVQDIYVYNKRN